MIAGNEAHTYFRVNSLFWDPNIFGRYLVLVVLAVAAYMVWTRRSARASPPRGLRGAARGDRAHLLPVEPRRAARRPARARRDALGVRWALAAVAVPALAAAGRCWRPAPTQLEQSLDIRTSGRASLVRGGLELAADRAGAATAPGRSRSSSRALSPTTRPRGIDLAHRAVTVAAEQGRWDSSVRGARCWPARRPARAAPIPAPRRSSRASPASRAQPRLRRPAHRPGHVGVLAVGFALARAPLPSPLAERTPRPARYSAGQKRVQAVVLFYLRRLATTGAAYTAASVLSKLIAVALLPIYTQYLSPADYGAAEVMVVAVIAASIVIRFGVIEALLRFYYLADEDPDEVVRDRVRVAVLDDDAAARRSRCRSRSRSRRRCSTARRRAGADRDRRALGDHALRVPRRAAARRRARPRLLPLHDGQHRSSRSR